MATIEEQIAELEEQISNTKYNKATEGHIGKLKAKIAKLSEEAEKRRSRKANTKGFYVKKAGDSTNHIHLYSKGSEKDSAHKCYKRAGSSGAWTDLSDSIRFKVYEGVVGVPVHEIYGTNGYVTLEYTAGIPTKQYYYLPPSDGAAGGIRSIMTLAYASGILTGGAVT